VGEISRHYTNDHHFDAFGANLNHNTSTASNTSKPNKDEDELTISYGGAYKDSALERNKRDRIKQLNAPHLLMQE
jgi:hypothetical protein